MSDKLVTVATFQSATSAHAARSRLADEGIRAVVTDDVVVETLWHVSPALGGIRLRVMSGDLPRAQAVLSDIENRETAAAGPWRCGPCEQDVEDGFDVCWSCSRPREEVEDRTYVGEPAAQHPDLSDEPRSGQRFAADDLNPYRASELPTDVELPVSPGGLDAEDTVRRALRASVIGLILCPVALHFYSMYLLAAASLSGQRFSRAVVWQFYLALAVNIVATIVYAYAFMRPI